MTRLDLADSLDALATILTPLRNAGRRIGFVPTMGALHAGHLSLIEVAAQHADDVVVSIFVNPRQFGPNEDFDRYPRTLETDLEALSETAANVVYSPSVDVMYPEGAETVVSVPRLSIPLDGTSRPGFFDGVATVVAKLFNQVRPAVAVFGEKDFQQLLVVRKMVRDLDMEIDVIGAPILREEDGLAMSSRNRYLSTAERAVAGQLNGIMRRAAAAMAAGDPIDAALARARADMASAGLAPIDYLEVRAAPNLTLLEGGPVPEGVMGDARLFAAVMVGQTRLIDNMALIEA